MKVQKAFPQTAITMLPGKTGDFTIKVGSEYVVKLEGLKRPFKDLKDLDFDDIIERIRGII